MADNDEILAILAAEIIQEEGGEMLNEEDAIAAATNRQRELAARHRMNHSNVIGQQVDYEDLDEI